VSSTEIRHDLFVYETDAMFAAQVERFVVAGIEADESVIVVVGADKRRLLRDALGAATELVAFIDTSAVYTRPEAAMATYDATVRKAVESLEAGIRVYGELPVCETQAEWDAWIAYEAIVNRAFANRPVALMCGYDARLVPASVIEQAWQAHRVVHADVWQLSRQYEDPADLVRSLAPVFEPLPGLRSLPVGDGRVHERLAEELAADGLPAGRARDLLVAAREVLSNAESYGNGVQTLRVGRVEEQFVCEIKDAGAGFDDPLAGFLPPIPLQTQGTGLWIARQLTARLELHREPDGFVVRFWV
jgi:anti-sigma regulatory factor (Ser/Thr protein kinase)